MLRFNSETSTPLLICMLKIRVEPLINNGNLCVSTDAPCTVRAHNQAYCFEFSDPYGDFTQISIGNRHEMLSKLRHALSEMLIFQLPPPPLT